MSTRPKATLRRDGKRRYTIRQEFHLSFDDIVNVVANRVSTLGAEPPGPNNQWTAADVMRLVRRFIYEHGDPGVKDSIVDDIPSEFVDEVRGEIAPLFPDLLKGDA